MFTEKKFAVSVQRHTTQLKSSVRVFTVKVTASFYTFELSIRFIWRFQAQSRFIRLSALCEEYMNRLFIILMLGLLRLLGWLLRLVSVTQC